MLHREAARLVEGWHPAVRRIVADADVPATFTVRITSARPVTPWTAPNMTLLGDAIHTMSPGRGDGANIALKDAQMLVRSLRRAAPQRHPRLQARRDLPGRNPQRQQQAGQRVSRVDRLLPRRVSVQREEDLPAGEPVSARDPNLCRV